MAVIDWIAILAGFGSAVLASMGMGGGSILILYLTLMAGVPQREAQGMNLLFFLPIRRRLALAALAAGPGGQNRGAGSSFPPGCWGQRWARGWPCWPTRACSAGDLLCFCCSSGYGSSSRNINKKESRVGGITPAGLSKLEPEVQNMMHDNKSPVQKFLEGKGFYIALALCVAGTGTAAWLAVNRTIDNIDEQNQQILESRPQPEDLPSPERWTPSRTG